MPTRGPDPVRRLRSQPRHRLRPRRPAHARRGRRLRLEGERDDDLDRDPESARASVARRRRRLVLALVGLAFGALLAVSGATSGTATPLMLGVSLIFISVVPLLQLAGVPERLAFTAGGLAVVVSLLLPWRAWEAVFGNLAMDFWDVDRGRPHDRRRHGLGDRLQRRRPPRRRHAGARAGTCARAGPAHVDRLPAPGTVPHGHDAGDVHPRGLHARDRERVERVFVHAIDVDDFGGGFQVRAGTVGAGAVEDMSAALRNAPGIRAEDYPVVEASPCSPCRRSSSEPAPAGGVPRPRPRRLVPVAHDLRPRPEGEGYESEREVWDAVRNRPGLAVVDSFVVPPPRLLELRAPARLQGHGLLLRGGAVRPDPARGLRQADRPQRAPGGRRGPEGHRPDGDDLASHVTGDRLVAFQGGRPRPSITSTSRPASTPRTPRRTSSPRSSRTASRPSRSRTWSTRRSQPT